MNLVTIKPLQLLLAYGLTRCMSKRVLNLGICVCPFLIVRYCSKVHLWRVLISVKISLIMFLPGLNATSQTSAEVLKVLKSMFSEHPDRRVYTRFSISCKLMIALKRLYIQSKHPGILGLM